MSSGSRYLSLIFLAGALATPLVTSGCDGMLREMQESMIIFINKLAERHCVAEHVSHLIWNIGELLARVGSFGFHRILGFVAL